MSYAIRKDGMGWRAVNSPEDVGPDEDFSEAQPAPIAQDQNTAVRMQIDALERQQLMPRATREFMLLFMETNFTAEQLTANYGYKAVKAFDNQIQALRAQLV